MNARTYGAQSGLQQGTYLPPAAQPQNINPVWQSPVERLTLGTAASPFGCCNFFDSCTDEIMSLYYRGKLDLLDWMGFNVTEECYRSIEFISYVRPEQSQGSDTGGYLSDPCAAPNGIEFGSCKLSVEDFGRFGRSGPVRDVFKPTRYCKTRPRYFLDGSPVESEMQWDMLFTMDTMLNDIRRAVINGNATTGGQFDGLQRWVKTGYDCSALDSYVVNWNSNTMAGGAGITINGAATPAGFNFIDFLLDLHRNVKQRISWSPMLNNQQRMIGDTIIVLPTFLGRCLLDEYTCWSVCPGAQYEEVVKDNRDMRDFRLSLNGGLFGHGQISLDGDVIPLLNYDWANITGPTRGDIYYLTGSIGTQRIWEGEHLSADVAMNELRGEADMTGNPGDFFSTDGGRVLGKVNFDELCKQIEMWMRPRLWCQAPWAQIRFQNVRCATPSGPLSPDPSDTSFYPQTSFSAATC